MEQTEKILVLGSLIMDLSVRCRQAPREGETVYTDDDYQANPGGKGGKSGSGCRPGRGRGSSFRQDSR